jgi:hypothetical protein
MQTKHDSQTPTGRRVAIPALINPFASACEGILPVAKNFFPVVFYDNVATGRRVYYQVPHVAYATREEAVEAAAMFIREHSED